MQQIDVLIVEDDESIVELVQAVLEEYGYTSQAAASGKDALNVLQQRQPRLVLLDLMLPGMSGWDVVEEMRRSAQTAQTPVVVMSGIRDVAAEASSLGVAGHLVKPFAIDDLVNMVARLTGQAPREAA